jgi:serine protease inhibitor
MNPEDRHSDRTEEHRPRPAASHRHRTGINRRLMLVIAAASVLVLAVVGWGAWALFGPKAGPTPVLANPPTSGSASAAPSAPLVSAINGFGFDVLRRMSDANPSIPSVVISPVSIHVALAMTEAGAVGNTSTQMRRVLRIQDMKPAVEHQAYADLLASLVNTEKGQLAIANSIWADKDVTIKQAFLDTNAKFFGAQARAVDLKAQSGVDEINSWVSKNTNDKIARMIDKPLSASASLELLDATYFLGKWATPFEASLTKPMDFHVPSGPAIKTQMMSGKGRLGYAKTSTYEAVRLPYKGSSASMLVILPSEKSSLPRFLKTFDSQKLTKVRDGLVTSDVEVKLPKLESRGSIDLRDALSAMGMTDAFSTSHAEFKGITDAPAAWIDQVQHSTYLLVDEQGTEAAAATHVSVGITAVAPERPSVMTVDRPYLILIVDERTGAVLFSAAVRDPRG